LPLPVDAGDFGLISRRVIDAMRRAPEYHRYLRGLRTWAGFQQVGIPIERDERFAGASKYNLIKLVGLAFDGTFSFSVVPLRVVAALGALTIVGSATFGAYALYAALILNRSPQGFTALVIIVMFLSGVILVSLGIIGEYVGRVYEEVKARPLYVVDEVARSTSAPTDRARGTPRAS
jgi:dolichol-phosphate mannosyltransferase